MKAEPRTCEATSCVRPVKRTGFDFCREHEQRLRALGFNPLDYRYKTRPGTVERAAAVQKHVVTLAADEGIEAEL